MILLIGRPGLTRPGRCPPAGRNKGWSRGCPRRDGTGQAMIRNEATIEDVIRMAYSTSTCMRTMRLPSRADRI